LNIHASLLPRWRGAAPIHRAIMAGDAETGVCIMQMEAGLDTGPVLSRAVLRIGETETTGALHDRLAALGASQIVEVLAGLDGLEAQVQPEEGVTYAAKIDKAEARVDWTRPAVMARGSSCWEVLSWMGPARRERFWTGFVWPVARGLCRSAGRSGRARPRRMWRHFWRGLRCPSGWRDGLRGI